MKKSTEYSRGEMNKASTTEAKLSNKAEYYGKLRKDYEVTTYSYYPDNICNMIIFICLCCIFMTFCQCVKCIHTYVCSYICTYKCTYVHNSICIHTYVYVVTSRVHNII